MTQCKYASLTALLVAFDPSASLKDLFGDCKGQELLEKIFNTYQAE